jgi:hypothetical protein
MYVIVGERNRLTVFPPPRLGGYESEVENIQRHFQEVVSIAKKAQERVSRLES